MCIFTTEGDNITLYQDNLNGNYLLKGPGKSLYELVETYFHKARQNEQNPSLNAPLEELNKIVEKLKNILTAEITAAQKQVLSSTRKQKKPPQALLSRIENLNALKEKITGHHKDLIETTHPRRPSVITIPPLHPQTIKTIRLATTPSPMSPKTPQVSKIALTPNSPIEEEIKEAPAETRTSKTRPYKKRSAQHTSPIRIHRYPATNKKASSQQNSAPFRTETAIKTTLEQQAPSGQNPMAPQMPFE